MPSLWCFKWLNKQGIDKFDADLIECNSIEINSSYGYISEVDLEYPDELHELHNVYPLAPEKFKINHNMLPNYWSNIANKYERKISNVNKLVPNLGKKSRYALYYKNPQNKID